MYVCVCVCVYTYIVEKEQLQQDMLHMSIWFKRAYCEETTLL